MLAQVRMAQNNSLSAITSDGVDSVASFIAGEMIQTSLQCSASDLQLCLALQSDSIFKSQMAPTTKITALSADELEIDDFFCLPTESKNRDLQRSLWLSQQPSARNSVSTMFHSQGAKRVDSSSDGDISLDENALCFSPMKSINTLLTQTDSSSLSQTGSGSGSGSASRSLLAATKHNYFLAFQDTNEQSGIMDQSMGPLSPRRMNDSGTVCSSSRSSSSDAAKQLKCWTDVVDEGQESIVASLTNARPLSTAEDNGYSSATKPDIRNRMRPSPSLPLTNTSDSGNTGCVNDQKERRMPRSGFSAPNLSFLNQTPSPNIVNPPLRINHVEDWESLQVLLPPQIRELIERRQGKSLSVSRTPSFASSKKFSRRGSLESPIPEESSTSDVCPTCFKVSGDDQRRLQQSHCNCLPKSAQKESFDDNEDTSSDNDSDGFMEKSTTADLMDFSSCSRKSRQNQLIIDLKQKRELVTCVKAAVMGLIGFREIRKSRSAALSRVIEQQFTSALQDLLEDGLKPGLTLWSGLIIPCSPPAYQQHVIPMQLSDPRFLSDEERFQAFVKELMRLGDLLNWLKQALHSSTTLKKSYVMDAFVFLIGSVTKDMWDDLTDTLALLNVSLTPRSSKNSYSAKIVGGVSEQNADRKRRLLSKMRTRQTSVLPTYPKFGFSNSSSSPRSSPEKESVTVGRLMAQPRLRMGSRWSDWTLSRKGGVDSLEKLVDNGKYGRTTPNGKSRKSPSMFDIRTFLL